ncbi:MAG: hypothetical protein SVU69_13550 [Pseudomonadota bacterium]|nr:hypothetical protein [Pseudomonadota bacterium]
MDARVKDFQHLKLMIDFQRHLGLLSFAGIVLTTNLSLTIFEDPGVRFLAFLAVASFFTSIMSSVMSQVVHIDRTKKDVIYEYPLEHRFAVPTVLSGIGVLSGVAFMAVFVLLNWLEKSI